MSIKIDIYQYRIQQTSPWQYTVGIPYKTEKGFEALQQPRYFNTMSRAVEYIRQRLVLEQDISTADQLAAAEQSAAESMKFWIATTPLKDLEVPR